MEFTDQDEQVLMLFAAQAAVAIADARAHRDEARPPAGGRVLTMNGADCSLSSFWRKERDQDHGARPLSSIESVALFREGESSSSLPRSPDSRSLLPSYDAPLPS